MPPGVFETTGADVLMRRDMTTGCVLSAAGARLRLFDLLVALPNPHKRIPTDSEPRCPQEDVPLKFLSALVTPNPLTTALPVMTRRPIFTQLFPITHSAG